jgi:hypothetical protein
MIKFCLNWYILEFSCAFFSLGHAVAKNVSDVCVDLSNSLFRKDSL